jgi:GNAT superfamily N-acetyltransferase
MRIVRTTATDPRLPGLQAFCLPFDDPRDFVNDAVWLALEGDAEVGFASVCITGRMAYLSRAGVVPSHRGRGLQKRMIRARVAYAKRNGCECVITDTTTSNLASANSLITSGFKLYRPQWSWALSDSLYWRLELC